MAKEAEKILEQLDDASLQKAWNQQQADAANDNYACYTHTLTKPLERDGRRYKTLRFDYSRLTGRDSLSIERDILAEFGKLVAVPEYTPEYLVNMAARSCTERNEQGNPFVNVPLLLDLPLRDFKEICASARRFLQWSESLSETEDDGSGQPA